MRRRRFGSKNEITAQWGANSSWEDFVHGRSGEPTSPSEVGKFFDELIGDVELSRNATLTVDSGPKGEFWVIKFKSVLGSPTISISMNSLYDDFRDGHGNTESDGPCVLNISFETVGEMGHLFGTSSRRREDFDISFSPSEKVYLGSIKFERAFSRCMGAVLDHDKFTYVSNGKYRDEVVTEKNVSDYLGSLVSNSSMRSGSETDLSVSKSTVNIAYGFQERDLGISFLPTIDITLDVRGMSGNSSRIPYQGARIVELKYRHWDLLPEVTSSDITSQLGHGSWHHDASSYWAVAVLPRDFTFGSTEFEKYFVACYKHAIILTDWYTRAYAEDEDGKWVGEPQESYPFRKRNENRRFR